MTKTITAVFWLLVVCTRGQSVAPATDDAPALQDPCPTVSFPFIENFSYPPGTLPGTSCWSVHSAGSNPVSVCSGSLTYPGYPSSGTGNATLLSSAGGEDIHCTFPPQTSGRLFLAFLIKVSSASSTGEYFIHLGKSAIGNIFRGRIFIKKDAADQLAFGIAQSTVSANYSSFSYSTDITHLVVMRYSVNPGGSNDSSAIIINPVITGCEPESGWIRNTDASGTDLTEIGSVALRQGAAGASPGLTIDGIRVAATWGEAVGFAWSGAVSVDWSDPANWTDHLVPAFSSNVFILPRINQPHVLSSPAECQNLIIEPGAVLTIENGMVLNVYGSVILKE